MEKKIPSLLLLITMISSLFAQSVGINTTGNNPDPSAMLDIESTTQGILVPRMNTTQRTLISAPATGLLVYDTDSNTFWFYDGTSWIELTSNGAAELIDSDNDTQIQVEESPDEDIIRFDVSGMETFQISESGLLSDIAFVSGYVGPIPANGPGTRLMWVPQKAALRIGEVTGNQWDLANIGDHSTVAGGINNMAVSRYSFVGGGEANEASGPSTFVGGGEGNTAAASRSFVGSGLDNNTGGIFSAIAAGQENVTLGARSFVGGGFQNTASGELAFVGAGRTNIASGRLTFVGGGRQNTAMGDRSFIGNGFGNVASELYASVLGGENNMASGEASSVGGGRNNSASASASFVAGGQLNVASNISTFIGGGEQNTASGFATFTGGGTRNSASFSLAFIGGGINNNATNYATFIGGGANNLASGDISFVGGGFGNTASEYGAFVAGGDGNTASGSRSFVTGNNNTAPSFAEATMGTYAELYTPTNALAPFPTDRLFVVGNGTSSTTRSNALTILKNGLTGIGRVPTTNVLEVEGEASKATAGDWLANSDARLKKNLTALNSEAVLTQILQLKGITYEWNDTLTGTQRPEGVQYGFTAQNIQAVFPELVSEDGLGYLQTAYGTYDAMYVEAIRALYHRIEELEAVQNDLESQLDAMKALEARLTQLETTLTP